MRGWCPRCDAVRQADGTCPECQAPLVDIDERPTRPAAREEEAAATELASVGAPPPRGRLRVALAVAAVVLVGLAFVAGRSTGGASARTSQRSTSTSQTTAPAAVELQRQLGWRGKPSDGIGVEAVSISRLPGDTGNGDVSTSDNSGTLTLRVDGLAQGRRLLGITSLRLVDSGGGVFAEPESRQIGGSLAVPVQPAGQADRYLVDLGPTPSVDTLDRIELQDLLVSAAAGDRGQVVLPTGGAWPARPPLRAVEPSESSVSVPVTRANGSSGELPLRVASAFVGAGRAVVVLSLDEQAADRDLGTFPVTAVMRASNRVVCSRLTVVGQDSQFSPLLVIDCPTSPAAELTVELAAGVDVVQLRASLEA
jgi:hypothetical protein